MSKRESLVVIGGGAAGMMAALAAQRARPELKIILVEHEEKLGRKLLVCGAGRCNVTNVNVTPEHFAGASPPFIRAVLDQFDHRSVQAFFDDLGIPLYEEKKNDKGKLFPVTNQAQTVHSLLIDELQRAGVEIRLGVHVVSVTHDAEGFKIRTAKGRMWSQYLILASGGKTYPKLGGDGSGYDIAAALGHRIVEPVPTATALIAPNPLSQALAGVRAEMEVAAIVGGKEAAREADQMMFAKTGFTGPVILNISRPIALRLHRDKKTDCALELKFLPGLSREQIAAQLASRWEKRPQQKLSLSLAGIMERKLPDALLAYLNIADVAAGEAKPADQERLIDLLAAWRVPVENTRGWDEGEFTAGGVDCRDVKEGTLESQKVPGLYFAGEVLDVDGEVGGFNLTWAWSSGHVAGQLGGH